MINFGTRSILRAAAAATFRPATCVRPGLVSSITAAALRFHSNDSKDASPAEAAHTQTPTSRDSSSATCGHTHHQHQSQHNGKSQSTESKGTPIGRIQPDKPAYQLMFTCKKCETRSRHTISKQAYHNGTVLVQCPGCKNRHLIADHLKIFSDERITIEDILQKQGKTITKLTVSQRELEKMTTTDGDFMWEGPEEGITHVLPGPDESKPKA